jgi:DNA-binding LacI/PurR family transcriptional regulator
MRAVKEKKLKIPEDISIIGSDDIEMASYLDAQLTTVKYPSYMIGTFGVEHIVKLIEQPNAVQQSIKVMLEPELIIRQST